MIEVQMQMQPPIASNEGEAEDIGVLPLLQQTSIDDQTKDTVTLAFCNINYTIGDQSIEKRGLPFRQPIARKSILSDVSGVFTFGMNAILGRPLEYPR